jgi:hypothetical protein
MPADTGSDDDALATTREGGCGVLTRAPSSDRDFSNRKTRSGLFRAGAAAVLDDVTMPVICPTCQTSWPAPIYFIALHSASEAPLTNSAS